MEKLGKDILDSIIGYYDDFVAVLPRMALAIIVFILALFIASWMKKISRQALAGRVEDPLLVNFLAQIIKTVIIIIGIIMVLNIVGLGAAAASLLAGAGIGAFVIGFAFKDIGENFLAGMIMAFKRPFRIGDVIETGSIVGTVIGLTLRDTQVKTFAGKDVFIPNGMIMKNPIVNLTIDGYLRYDFAVGLDYADNLSEGVSIIEQTIKETPGVLDIPGKQASVLMDGLRSSMVNVSIYFWVDMDDPETSGVKVKAHAIERTVRALSDAGFYLPADIMEIKNYNDTSLNMESNGNHKL
ncbi:MAG: mechanosensitive ion channel domain-containing protein [Bacteroidota bacterium]